MSVSIAPNNAAIYYRGRWGYKTHSGTPIMAALWVGGNFRVKFSGTACTIKILAPSSDQYGDTRYYPEMEYSVDGGAFVRRDAISDAAISGLAAGTHTLEVWFSGAQHSVNRWAYDEGLMFAGLTLNDGASVSAWEPDWIRGRAMFIGDSITEGAWALTYVYGDTVTLPSNTDARGSYPQLIGRVSDMEIYNCGLNGWGFYVKSGFPAPATAMGYTCKDVTQGDPAMNYIVIALGHNHTYDYSMSDATFEAYYTELIAELRTIHPESRIMCFSLFSPTWAAMGGGVGAHRNTSIAKVAAENECIFIDCSAMPAAYLPVGGHASVFTAPLMAEWLLDRLNPYFHAHNVPRRTSIPSRTRSNTRIVRV